MQNVVYVNPDKGIMPVVQTSWQNLPNFSYDDPNVLCTPLIVEEKGASFLLWGVSNGYEKPVLLKATTGDTPDEVLSSLAHCSISNQVWSTHQVLSVIQKSTVRAYNYKLDLTPRQKMTEDSEVSVDGKKYKDFSMLEALAYLAASRRSRLEYLMIAGVKEDFRGLEVEAVTSRDEQLRLNIPSGVPNQVYLMATGGFLERHVGKPLLCEFNPAGRLLSAIYY